LQAVETLGVDSSAAMLERAQSVVAPGLRFLRGDIATFHGEAPFDVVFSNAALQWLPDHPRLLAHLRDLMQPGGELAVQVPANFDHPSHAIAAEVAAEAPFRDALDGYVRQSPVLAPEEYANLLHALGFGEHHVRLQVYGHVLESTDAVVEWTRGTLLTDYEVRMPAAVFERFVQRYRERLVAVLGDSRPYFYAFKRILFWARRVDAAGS
jgi:trans-aconitate 2-methyltransferase